MRIVLLGAPGSGKGTQCRRIADRYSLAHLSSGDILRSQRSAGTELGEKARRFMDAGELVPDELIVEMMASAMKKAGEGGFVLDGFPRTVNQAEQLDKQLAVNGKGIYSVLNLKVDYDLISRRMSGRRSCPQCGAVYHIENLKPKTDGICDNDGTKLVQRPDDTLQVVKNRLETYHRQSEPVVDYYKDRSTVYDIDASADVKQVSSLIFEKLDAFASAGPHAR